jgi:AraC-like DNA-binding protein
MSSEATSMPTNANTMYELHSQLNQRAIYVPGIPDTMSHYKITGASSFHASGDYGKQLFQHIKGTRFEACSVHFLADRTGPLYFEAEKSLLTMRVAMRNHFHYHLRGIGDIRLPERGFNFIFSPRQKGHLHLQSGQHYWYFEVHPPLMLLEELAGVFPLLEAFLQQAKEGRPAVLKEQPPVVTLHIQDIVYEILYNSFEGDLRKLHFETKVFELLLMGLHTATQEDKSSSPPVLTAYDIEKVHEAATFLLKNIDNPGTISHLAQKLKISESKLRRGFRQEYGATPFDFLLQRRIERAKHLLLTTNMQIRDIAAETGYNKVSNFIIAFKKIHGQPPAAFRKKY